MFSEGDSGRGSSYSTTGMVGDADKVSGCVVVASDSCIGLDTEDKPGASSASSKDRILESSICFGEEG